MKSTVGNLLLVIGTVFGGIAAANSAKASRWLELGDAHPGEFLMRDVEAGDRTLEAGTELSGEVVGALRAAGLEGVEVKDPPRESEVVAGSDRAAYEGRSLAADVVVGTKESFLKAGKKKFDGDLLKRLLEAGEASVEIEKGDARETVALMEELDVKPYEGYELAEDMRIVEPDRLKADSFIDAERGARIEAAGVDEVELKITKEFTFGGWERRWLFAAAVAAMVVGIVLKRADRPKAADVATGRAGDAGGLRADLVATAEAAAKLETQVDGLDADAIHTALDPILSGPIYRVVEGRELLAVQLGAVGFADMMGAFSNGERALNRAWSAAVDGNVEEARACVHRAAPALWEAAQQVTS